MARGTVGTKASSGRRGTRGLVLLALICVAALADRAESLDRVALKDGRVLEGRILTVRFLHVFIETPQGNETIPMNQVEKIDRNVGEDAAGGGAPAPGKPAAVPNAIPEDAVPEEERRLHDELASAIRRQDAAAEARVVRRLAGARARKSLQVLALVVTSDMALEVHLAAVEAMTETRDPEGLFVEPLCRLLRDGKDAALREACARALEKGEYREKAVETLVEVLAGLRPQDADTRPLRAACLEVLAGIAGRDFGAGPVGSTAVSGRRGEGAAARWRDWWNDNRAHIRDEDARRREELTGLKAAKEDQAAPGAQAAAPAREIAPEDRAAAEAAYPKLRRAVIKGVTDGLRRPLSVRLGGRTVRGWTVEADEEKLVLRDFGSGAEVSVPWREIPPAKFLHLARQYTGDRELLGAYARGHGLGPN